ncbi:hypothetical protein ANCCEY_06319 [Ancylostoma ceylanicum]|uniref:Uncharacterized protein n=1 Tax=Ancylostoma ceylanicum TaxID=53326 RepID=A0A0D6LRS8_9BILA|nr:hypothetical protein ANCCEY_06319 [Ancylostoma ceylanicum]
MKSVFVILACCVIATFSCPKTTTIDRSDFNNAAFVSVVEVQSVSGNWETMVLGVKEKIALKVASVWYRLPNKIKIPEGCGGVSFEDYAVGCDSNYGVRFLRRYRDLSTKEKQILGFRGK